MSLASPQALDCPACLDVEPTPLERIQLDEQHAYYSPQPETQRRLTALTGVIEGAVQMHRCRRCHLEFASPLQAPGGDWYDLVYELLPLYPEARWEFDFVSATLAPNALVGELGCGSGVFLQRCRAAGVSAIGVDFSPEAIASCQSAGLDAHIVAVAGGSSRLPTVSDRHAIIAFQILEHLDAPDSLFEMATAWATTDATLWVAVPSDRRPSRFFRERDHLDQPPHHMSRWTRDALAAIGARHEWTLAELLYEPISLKTSIWWFATRHPLYVRLPTSLRRSRAIEGLARLAVLPFALLSALRTESAMSGSTMLARYERRSPALG